MRLGRRELLAAGAGLLLGGRTAASAPERCDVLIVGSGIAGLAAAVSAAEAGAREVAVLEKELTLGGHSILSSGYITGVERGGGTEEEYRAAVKSLADDMERTAGGRGRRILRETVAAESGAALQWLRGMGVILQADTHLTVGGAVRRSYISSTVRAGHDYVVWLNRTARRLGVRVLLGTRARGLVIDETEGVCGVRAAGRDGREFVIRAAGTVLASGGFGGNVSMRMIFDQRLDGSWPTTADPWFEGTDSAQGDGILLAMEAGAEFADMECIQVMPFWGGRLADYVGADIFLDGTGRRFVNEGSSWKEISEAILKLPGERCWVLTDSRSRHGGQRSFKLMEGLVREAATLEEAARGMGVAPEALRGTLERYNRFAGEGYDADFGKRTFTQKIDTPPFYYGRERLYVHCCCGGAAIDERARVTGKDGSPVPGLFAAGEVTGGVHGEDRVGGCGLMDALVFGRIAGREAAGRAARRRR